MMALDNAFLDWVCDASKIKKRHLVEKDFYLHSLLGEIAKNEYLQSRLLFKGGTCIVKAYVPYYRFSEDIDFGWQDPGIWANKSKKRIEKDCLIEIKRILEELEMIAGSLNLGFNPKIDEREGVFISNSGTKVTMHFIYSSSTPTIQGRLKMEINLQDLIKYPICSNVTLRSFIGPFQNEMGALFEDEYERY